MISTYSYINGLSNKSGSYFGKIVIISIAILAIVLSPAISVGAKSKNVESIVSSSSLYGGSLPDIAKGDNGFGVVFDDSRDGNNEIYFTKLDKNGQRIGSDTRITNDPGNSWEPKINWDGHNYGVVWYDTIPGGFGIFFAKVSSDGTLITPNIMISSDGVSPSAVWNKEAHEYGVTWYADNIGSAVAGANFVRIDSDGNLLSPIVSLNTDNHGGPYGPSIATNGKGYSVGWSDNHGCNNSCSGVFIALLNRNGQKVGLEHQLTFSGNNRLYSMAWNGKEYALATIGDFGPEIITSSILGALTSDYILEGQFEHPSYLGLVWNDNNYVLSFTDRVFSNGAGNDDPILASYDKQGHLLGGFERASSGSGLSWAVSAPVETGDSFAVVWVENLYDPSQNISFAKVNLSK